MTKQKGIILWVGATVLLGSQILMPASARAGLCDDPVRNQKLCRQMNHLRSGLNFLEAQRELLQVNYPLLAALGLDMAAVAQDALKESASGAPENHLSPLKAVIEKTTRLAAEATKSSPNALVTANQIKAQCAACHTGQGTGAASGHLWTDIANYNWEVVHTACNKPGRNPFLCKNMHGLASSYNFLVTGFEAQRENYDALSLSATEMLRISEALEATGVFHGNGDLIGALKNDVKAVLTVAHRRDPNAFEKSRNLGQACVSCHSGPYGR